MKTASIVIPCFNEEETLPEFYRRIAEMSATVSDTEFDFIFVNDCSSDSTGSILQELSKRDPRVRVLELAANSGHQRAVTAGLDFSRGESVIIIDADLQDPPELIPEMIQLVQSGFDVVHAQRKHREGESVFKLGTARLFYVALGKLSTTRIVENCGDFRAISSRVAATIQTFREPHRFLRGLFSLVGFNQCILRFNRHQRFAGTTKYSLRKMVRLASDALFSFSTAPIRAILWLAASLWMLSLVYLALTLFQWAAGHFRRRLDFNRYFTHGVHGHHSRGDRSRGIVCRPDFSTGTGSPSVLDFSLAQCRISEGRSGERPTGDSTGGTNGGDFI